MRATAQQLLTCGVTLVAGRSAQVFHGVADRIFYDMGEFVDDCAVHPELRNDLGLLVLVNFDGPPSCGRAPATPVRLEALPLVIEDCRTRLADGEEREWISNGSPPPAPNWGRRLSRAEGDSSSTGGEPA
ncbi:hypothetical protein [Streptacidiphilus anmyonensis]|uniref:hypothetical protein n=1 Tax=Streptacidiphilus anmyonensis TaxID=405782 RepID=UPI000693F9AD|nr:hypothetical protein [Streptacidiphilus anmyonensis]